MVGNRDKHVAYIPEVHLNDVKTLLVSLSFVVQGFQNARLCAVEAEACARCTTPGHFSLFWSL